MHISLLADGLYRRLAVRNCDTGGIIGALVLVRVWNDLNP